MFFNISNHPSSKWSAAQLDAANSVVTDVQFPNVPPTLSSAGVTSLAREIVAQLLSANGHDFFRSTAMVQGEFSLTFELSRMLLGVGVSVVVATTERVVTEQADGQKLTTFAFIGFRPLRG